MQGAPIRANPRWLGHPDPVSGYPSENLLSRSLPTLHQGARVRRAALIQTRTGARAVCSRACVGLP